MKNGDKVIVSFPHNASHIARGTVVGMADGMVLVRLPYRDKPYAYLASRVYQSVEELLEKESYED